jgi:hypothetical protein
MSLVRGKEQGLRSRNGFWSRGFRGRSLDLGRSRLGSSRAFRSWMVAWVGGSILGMVNGTARELLYKDSVGEHAAHYISTATLLVLLALYVAMLQRRWPIPTGSEALSIGACWLALTVAFEFGFGHFVDGKSWAELRALYDVTEGKIWILVPLFMATAPAFSRHLTTRA